jgi:anti-sigma factor RsiW
MACDEWKSRIDTYLDGELTADEMRSLDSHVRSCPTCAADVLARVQLKRAIKVSGKRFAPSPELRKKVLSPARRGKQIWGWATAAIAAILLIALGIGYVGQQSARRNQVFAELADLHVATLASANPVDVVSSDRHTVKPWFEGKIPFTFNLPELQNSEFSLIGGRVTYLGQRPGAQLIFLIRKHRISVVIVQDQGWPTWFMSGSGVQQKLSFNQQTWKSNGLRFFIVGDAPPADIARLGDLLKNAAKE